MDISYLYKVIMSSGSKPITIEEFKLVCETLSLAEATGERKRLENSIRHLVRSNRELEEVLEGEDDEELKLALSENKIVIDMQNTRIEIIDRHIDELGGGDGESKHSDGVNDDNSKEGTEVGIYL